MPETTQGTAIAISNKKAKQPFTIKLPIFRYTFKKILVSPSTWVILALTILILGLGWIIFPVYVSVNGNTTWTPEIVKTTPLFIWKQIAFFGLVGLMLFIFIAVKAVQIFRDEIDDGTLLILVSKPISRTRIWAEKWLSFQAIMIGYLFLSIFVPSIFLLIPIIAGPIYYMVLFPYLWILFAIALLVNLIISSITLLISMILNSKSTVALLIGFAAVISIFAKVIDPIITIPANYLAASQAVETYLDLKKSPLINQDDITWFDTEQKAYINSIASADAYNTKIHDFMQKVYDALIPDVHSYPNKYDPAAEKVAVKKVADGKGGSIFLPTDVTLAQRIDHISNVYRQWDEQSIEELMTGTQVAKTPYNMSNRVEYDVTSTFRGLEPISEQDFDDINSAIKQKKIMRYFNVFYQIYYLFDGIISLNDSPFIETPTYINKADPYLIEYHETSPGSGQYAPDATSLHGKIINLPVLVTVYTLLGVGLLGSSWYVFNRRDFA